MTREPRYGHPRAIRSGVSSSVLVDLTYAYTFAQSLSAALSPGANVARAPSPRQHRFTTVGTIRRRRLSHVCGENGFFPGESRATRAADTKSYTSSGPEQSVNDTRLPVRSRNVTRKPEFVRLQTFSSRRLHNPRIRSVRTINFLRVLRTVYNT